jgi:hypothetical protein
MIAVVLIKEGDWVLLRRKESEKRKLAPLADGPFQVTNIGTNAVTLNRRMEIIRSANSWRLKIMRFRKVYI